MSKSTVVYFLDVGQGTSQVILLPGGSVVVIDCGKSASALVRLLKTIKPSRIEAVILSHWHDDHIGGVPALLDNHIDQIQWFYLPQERPAEDIRSNEIYTLIRNQSDNQKKYKIDRLERVHHSYGKIPLSCHAAPAVLTILYPDFSESLDAQAQKDGNQGSGVLMLEHANGKVLFPGDAGKKAFKALIKREGNRLLCDIIAAPHHSGKLNKGKDDFHGYRNCFHWFYSKVVDARYVVVSAGTGNTYGHPVADHAREAVTEGAIVICTQLTSQCVASPQSYAPSLLQPVTQPSACAVGQGVGCAGTIVATLDSQGVVIERLPDHQNEVDALSANATPLCRM